VAIDRGKREGAESSEAERAAGMMPESKMPFGLRSRKAAPGAVAVKVPPAAKLQRPPDPNVVKDVRGPVVIWKTQPPKQGTAGNAPPLKLMMGEPVRVAVEPFPPGNEMDPPLPKLKPMFAQGIQGARASERSKGLNVMPGVVKL
jgi:hypothetical protein